MKFTAFALMFGLFALPAVAAEGHCDEKKANCEAAVADKKTACLTECGLPILPGYKACQDKCADNQQAANSQCAAELNICSARAKIH
jgi:hypothetical protein